MNQIITEEDHAIVLKALADKEKQFQKCPFSNKIIIIILGADGSFTDTRYGYCASENWSFSNQELTINRTGACSTANSYCTETSIK